MPPILTQTIHCLIANFKVLALIFEDALHETAKETVSIPGDLASEAIHVVEEGILYDHFQRVLFKDVSKAPIFAGF